MEEDSPQDRAQGHTKSNRGGLGWESFELNELRMAKEIRFEPV